MLEHAEYEPEPLPPFICWDGRTFDMWNPTERTGHAETDFNLGRHYAVTVCDCARLCNTADIIAGTIEAMVKKGFWGDMERGFLSVVASRAYVGARN